MEDRKIVDLYWARSESAIVETKKKYDGYCSKTAYNILADKEDVKECVNDTYMRAWNSIPSHRPERLSTFLGKITRNLALNKWKSDTRQKRGGGQMDLVYEELEEVISDRTSPDKSFEAEQLAKAISTYLQRLSKDARRIFIGRYWRFDSIDIIAAKLGFSQSKVKSSLSRTRAGLKEYLLKEGYEV